MRLDGVKYRTQVRKQYQAMRFNCSRENKSVSFLEKEQDQRRNL